MTRGAAEVTLTGVFITALMVIIFNFLLPRVTDYAIDRNLKILKDLNEIRKTIEDGTPQAIQMEEIIEYRRNKHLVQQQKEYANSKNTSEIEALEKEFDKPWYKNTRSALVIITIVFVSSVLLAHWCSTIVTGWIFG